MSEGAAPDGRPEQVSIIKEMIRQRETDLDRLKGGLREREEALDRWRGEERTVLEREPKIRADMADNEAGLEALKQQIADANKSGRFGRLKSHAGTPPDALQEQLESRQEIAKSLDELLLIDEETLAISKEQIAEVAASVEEMRASIEKLRTTIDEGKSMLAVLRSADD